MKSFGETWNDSGPPLKWIFFENFPHFLWKFFFYSLWDPKLSQFDDIWCYLRAPTRRGFGGWGFWVWDKNEKSGFLQKSKFEKISVRGGGPKIIKGPPPHRVSVEVLDSIRAGFRSECLLGAPPSTPNNFVPNRKNGIKFKNLNLIHKIWI